MELTNQRLIRQGARDQSNDHVILVEAILSSVLSLFAEPRQSQALVTGFFARANVSTGSTRTSHTRPFEFCVWLQNGK